MPAINLPAEIKQALDNGATLAISLSGGKDSQALLLALMSARKQYGWAGKVFAIHADLGRAEWHQTKGFCEALCRKVGIELVVVQREAGDLQEEIEQRMVKLAGTGKPHFPSSAQRYCTSDQKRNPIDKYLRQFDNVISAEGVRGAESRDRAKKPCYEERTQIVTRTRTAYTWRPLFDWSTEDVWNEIGTSQSALDWRRAEYRKGNEAKAFAGWNAHPAYVMGNERLSCSICVLASRSDIINGAKHNPEYYKALVAMEEKSGFSFRQDLRLADLAL